MVSEDEEFESLVAAISGIQKASLFKHYIGYARFPNFKNLERDTVIRFDYPVTALVGANGSGKSSVLHALYGMPEGYSTARFWFTRDS